ncbi:MAG: DUF2804 domain-containing protein [Spirochaetaceae bacterium]|nr:DUF2804 domain-containing protein [Spirochaetaceae bacterium]
MAQHEVISPVELLDGEGHLVEEGWARQQLWHYDRSRIRAPWYRIKEWDYYCVLSQERECGIAFTVSDLGYAGLASMVWLDFAKREFIPMDSIKLLTRGKLGFPPSSGSGGLEYGDAKMSISYSLSDGERRIIASCPSFGEGKGLRCDLVLQQDLAADTMAIATSWKENRRAFYYNQKVNCMPAGGTVTIGDERHIFEPGDSFGVLDWGRGYWPYRNRWYWGSASGLHEGVPFGWNIGYGFSDRSPASENTVFYGGKAHKLEEITFHIDPGDYLAPWKFTSSDGRFEMDFEPILDRHSEMNLAVISSVQNQVFGYYSGQVKLDDGRPIKVESMLGFAEDVRNRW